jgi:hypothetical protein
MATAPQIKTFFHSQINGDSPQKAAEAGDNWTTFPLSFFYSNDGSVSLAVRTTMEFVLTIDHAMLSNQQFTQLDAAIDRGTLVSDAIDTMATFSAAATPV